MDGANVAYRNQNYDGGRFSLEQVGPLLPRSRCGRDPAEMWSYGLAARALIKSDELLVVLDSPILVTDSPIDTTQRDNPGRKTHKHRQSREERQQRQSEASAGSQEGECDDGL